MGKLKCQKHCEIQNVLSTKVKVRHTGPKDKRVKDKEENVKHILKKIKYNKYIAKVLLHLSIEIRNLFLELLAIS